MAALAAAIADLDPAPGQARGERIGMLVLDDAGEASAAELLAGLPVTLHRMPYGDIWLRDTGPIFLQQVGETPDLAAACFAWNGWGGKYDFPDDHHVAACMAARVAAPVRRFDLVFEGGALDGDGRGTALTTRQCVLNPNRTHGLGQAGIEARLAAALGVTHGSWLDRGLAA